MPETATNQRLDAYILLALQVSARATWREIADALGQHESTVARRAHRLLGAGRYHVTGVVDHLRVGAGFSVYIRFRAQPSGVLALAEAVAAHPATRYVAVTTGPFDVVAEAVVSTPSEVFVIRDAIYKSHPFLQAQTSPVIRKFAAYEDWTPNLLPPEAVEALKRSRHWASYSHASWHDQEKLKPSEQTIIQILKQNGRITYQELAAQVGITPAIAKKQTMSLVERGCLRFRTLFDGQLAGYNSEFLAWMAIKPDSIEQAGKYLKEHAASRYVALTMDDSDIFVHGLLPQYSDVYTYMTEAITRVPGLVRYELSLVLEAFKRAWVPIRAPTTKSSNVRAMLL